MDDVISPIIANSKAIPNPINIMGKLTPRDNVTTSNDINEPMSNGICTQQQKL